MDDPLSSSGVLPSPYSEEGTRSPRQTLPPTAAPPASPHGDKIGAAEADDGGAGEEEEEDYYTDDGYAYDYDEDDDDWVLEGILQRKVDRESGGGGGEFVYLCQWRLVDGDCGAAGGGPLFSTTWEARDTLEEAGYIPQLDAFDARRKEGNVKKPRAQPPIRPDTACARLVEDAFFFSDDYKDKVKLKHLQQQHAVSNGVVFAEGRGKKTPLTQPIPPPPLPSTTPVALWSPAVRDAEMMRYIVAHGRMPAWPFKIHHYARVASPPLARDFLERWEKKKATHTARVVFSGTDDILDLAAVAVEGLPVVRPAHWVRAHLGYGVHTLRWGTHATCESEQSKTGSIFVCLGLVPNVVATGDSKTEEEAAAAALAQFNKSDNDEHLVFRYTADVFPMWIVETNLSGVGSTVNPTEISFAEFLKGACEGGGFGLYRRGTCLPPSSTSTSSTANKGSTNSNNKAGDADADDDDANANKKTASRFLPLANPKHQKQIMSSLVLAHSSRGSAQQCGGGGIGNISKAALKGQPRRVKRMVAAAAAEVAAATVEKKVRREQRKMGESQQVAGPQ